MVFAAVNPRQRVAGTPFENVAEEVLNGLFCHYEPPVSEHAQHKAAQDVKSHPMKYTFSQVKKYQSILRTSRLFKRKQALAERKRKAVTWRDEQQRKGIEGHVEACAARNCDFLGLSTKGGDGLADSISPTQQVSSVAKPSADAIRPEPIIKPTPTSREPLKSAPSKKLLYDDEGNVVNGHGSQVRDENAPPLSLGKVPPAPTGLSQLRKMAQHLGDDMYEPEDYDNPSVKSEDSSKRRQSHRNATPRHTFDGQDKVTMTRSQSPVPSSTPNHYDTPEQFEGEGRLRGNGRPSTPYRQRGDTNDEMEIDYTDNSLADGKPASSPAVSPSRRSEVFSDLTMDEAISGHNRYKYPESPAKTSEGVEVDVLDGKARPRSPSPGRYCHNGTPLIDHEIGSSHSNTVYHDMGNAVKGSSKKQNEVRKSRKLSRDDRRRHSLNELPKPQAKSDSIVPKTSSRSRRISEPLPPMPKTRKNGFQCKADGPMMGLECGATLPSQCGSMTPPLVETAYDSEDEQVVSRRRDPTPRISLEPTVGSESTTIKGPLPPTPRRKDVESLSLDDRKDHRVRQRSTREERRSEPPNRNKDSSYSSQHPTAGLPSMDVQPREGNAYDWAYNALMTQFTPRSAGTDDEIRAEVSSVGMESHTLRPVQVPNPFVMKSYQPAPIIEERIPGLRPAVSDDAASEPSSISNSTLSSNERQPVKKAKPAEIPQSDSGASKKKKIQSKKHRESHRQEPTAPIEKSASSQSTRTKKLWKGWRKAVGKVKAIVKDIDEQRIPAPLLHDRDEYLNPHLEPNHPTLYSRY